MVKIFCLLYLLKELERVTLPIIFRRGISFVKLKAQDLGGEKVLLSIIQL